MCAATGLQNPIPANFDIHDRVNYAALSSKLMVDREKKIIQMNLELDDSICSVMDYFEIFLKRMLMCRRAAEKLGCRFNSMPTGASCAEHIARLVARGKSKIPQQ